MNTQRVLLDTNVWNYIVEVDGVEQLRKIAKADGVAIIACPAVVYESLRVRDPDVRRRRGKALSREDWTRVMPEAYSEAEDVRGQVQKLRPEWLVGAPDLRVWHRLRADWKSGFWWRVRREPGVLAAQIAALSDDALRRAREETKAARKQGDSLGHTVHSFKWNRATSTFAALTPGWDGNEFEAWRGQSVAHWWHALVEEGSQTALEWLGPWLDLSIIRADPASWTQFWTREVESASVPREWIRWAMAETQATRATSRGTPGDNQLATYLVEVDYLVTTDKVFADLAQAMRPHSPVRLAEVHRSPAGSEALAYVLALLQSLS